MTTMMDIFFDLMAASPVLAAVAALACFTLSVWSTQRTFILLQTRRASQTVEACDRWAIECDELRSKAIRDVNQDKDRKSWLRRGLTGITGRFPRSKEKREESHRRCEVSSCKAMGEAELCPMFFEQLRLLAADAPPAAAASSTVTSPDTKPAFKFLGFICNALRKPQRGMDTTASRLLAGGSKAVGSAGRAVGRMAKGAWSKIRRRAATTSDYEFKSKKGGNGSPTAPRPDQKRDVTRGNSDMSKPHRFIFHLWRQPPCHEEPKMLLPTPDKENKLLAAERALRGLNPSALRLSLGTNVVAFAIVGVWCYIKTRESERLRARRQQRRQREGSHAGGAPRVDGDSGGSCSEGSPAAPPTLVRRPRLLTAREPCLAWEDWDDPSLKSFLLEEGRTFENPVERRRQVAEFDERVALPQLARDWKVPFLSKRDFVQQQEATKGLAHIIDDNGRLVPRRGPPTNDGGGHSPATECPRQDRQDEEPLYWQRRYRQIQRRQVLWMRTPPRPTTVTSPPPRADAGTNANARLTADDYLIVNAPTISRSTTGTTPQRFPSADSSLEKSMSAGRDTRIGTDTGSCGGEFEMPDRDFDQFSSPARVSNIIGVASDDRRAHRACVWEWGKHKGVVYYAVEVETMGQRTATNLYRRYTQFLHLWKEVCRTHPKLRQFPFPPKEPAAGAKVVLAEVFGGKRPEDERQARFGDLLQRLMSLEPRPPALLAFLTPVPPVGARTAPAPAATPAAFSRQRGRSAPVPEQDQTGIEGRKSSGSPRSRIDGTYDSPPPDQRTQQQQSHQQWQHQRGGAMGGGLIPATGDRPTTARAIRHDTMEPTPDAVAEAAPEQREEERSAMHRPRDLRAGIFLLYAVGVVILDAWAILLYAKGASSPSSPASSWMTPFLNLFVEIGAVGPAVAVAVIVRVLCWCRASWQRGQGRLYPFQLFISSRLERHRTPTRPTWQRRWREAVEGDGVHHHAHRVLIVRPVWGRNRLRSLWGAATGAAGTAGDDDVDVRVGGTVDRGDSLRSDSSDAVEASGGPDIGRGVVLESEGFGSEGGERMVGKGVGSVSESRDRGRDRSRGQRRCMTAGRVRSLSGTRSPGRPSHRGQG